MQVRSRASRVLSGVSAQAIQGANAGDILLQSHAERLTDPVGIFSSLQEPIRYLMMMVSCVAGYTYCIFPLWSEIRSPDGGVH